MAPKSHHSAESNIKIERCQKEFREWVTANWHTGVRAASGPSQSVNGPPEFESSQYVSYKSLEARLSLQGIKEVIDAAFPEHQGDHPISLLNLRADYSKVFATLLYMGIPRAISHFVQHDDLADNKLPFKPNQPPAEFPQDIDYSEFCRYQHLFKVKTVRYWREDVEQRVDILLPFEVLPQPLGEGGSAVAYKIKIHEDYDELYNGTDFTHKPHDIYRHHYALKTFTGPYAKRDYDRERNAYIRLTRQERASRSLICFHGCFRQGPSYNILLEYADMGTLEEYLRDIPAPTTGLGTYQFWNSMLSIVEALYQLQNVLTTDEHTSSNFRGWHDDISPWNILVSSRGRQPGDYYNYKFMLADLGHCHFSKISESGAFAYSAKAGKTYASPESYELDEKMSREKSIVTLKSDVWSLACIFSEGATWAVQGWPALETYRWNRQERLSRDKGFKHTDCFHDSVRVLDTVTQQHQMLRGERRRSDRTTDYILNAIDTIFTNDDSMNAKVCLNMFATAMNSAKLEMASRSPRHALSRSGTSYHFAGNAHESRRHEASRANTDFPIPPNSWNMPGSHTNTDRAFVEEDDYTQSPHSSPSTPRDGPMFSSNSTPIEQQTPFPSRMPRHRSTSGAKKWEQPLVLDGLRARSTTFVTDSDDSVQSDPFVEGSDQSPESKRHRRSISTSNPPTLSLFQKQGSSDSGQTNGSTENQNPVSTGPTLDDLAASLREQKPNGKMWKWPFSKHSTSTTSKDFFKRFQHLTGRDFDLVVDDAPSMHQYWLDMIYVITIMSEILLKFDKDGIDLHFVGCSQSYAKLKSHEKIEKRMQKHWPNKEMVATGANVGPDVGRFLDNLMTKLKDSWKSDKAKTIYVFTDGIWEDGSAVDGAIKRVVDYLERRSSPDFHFTLQFIQFGNDPVGTERLRHYDDHMKSLERDIVDTEGRGGNAHKIFAGSFNKKLDGPSSDVASCRFCQAARLRTKS